ARPSRVEPRRCPARHLGEDGGRQGVARMAKGLVTVSEYAPGAGRTSGLDDARRRWYAQRLEEGHILLFEKAPFQLPDAAERGALTSVRQVSAAYHKNISYRPVEDRVKGIAK